MKEDWSENSLHTKEASMKKLISEEISKRQNRKQAAPNIVARLMGVDMMPSDTKSVMRSSEKDKENRGKKLTKKERNKPGSVAQESSKSSMLIDLGSTYNGKDADDDGWNCYQNSGKPKPREHPQEEELQKFKKEFEVWQAARVMECSKVVEGGGISRGLLAQENLNREKMNLYADSQVVASATVEPWSHTASLQRSASQNHSGSMILQPEKQMFYRPISRPLSGDFEKSLLIKYNARLDKSSPTRIVILKPGPDKVSNHEDSWIRSTDTFDERNSIEEFLQEVRERLKCELQGKTLKKGSVVRGSGIETPHSETLPYPRKIARHIAKQVRESVTRDIKINLPRSESTRSYKSDILHNEPGSPEFMKRNTRRFLSERLRNVLKSETHLNLHEEDGIYRSTSLDSDMLGIKQSRDNSQLANGTSYLNAIDEQEMQTRSFRYGRDDNITVHRELSPRNLVRSLSAPVSGTSFGKLLLEDRHVFTGAHIHRKHEANEAVPRDVEKRKKKHKFSFKERVSTLKYSFIIRGRLFGKKMQPLVESSHSNGHESMTRDFTNGPTVLRSLGDRRENATEVPPSPASLCSTSHEDFCRPGEYLSPISTPDLSSRDDNAVPHVFREISSNLNELRRQLNQLGSESTDEKASKQDTVESELLELEDEAESYLRDLLIASGLYSGSWDKALLKGDTFVKPIGNTVFDEVEESHRKLAKQNGSSTTKDHDMVSHKILFDLLNEALSTVLGPPKKISKFTRKSNGSTILFGKNLLDSVWNVVRSNLYPPSDKSYFSIDNMVARDLHSVPWLGSTDDEINSLGREIECLIVGDMVDDIVKDMKFSKVL